MYYSERGMIRSLTDQITVIENHTLEGNKHAK